MSNFLSSIKRKIRAKGWEECQGKKCSKGNCSLRSNPSDPALILDMDCKALKYPEETKKCDFSVFGAAGEFVAMEMKGGSPKPREVEAQITAGADFILNRLLKGEHQVRFEPWLVHVGKIGAAELRSFRRSKIIFAGRPHTIRLIKSGESLNKKLNEIPPA